MVGKYLAKLHLNKIYAYIFNNYCSEVLKNSVLEVFDSKRYFTKLLHVFNHVCSSEYVCLNSLQTRLPHLAITTCGRWKYTIKVNNRYDPCANYHQIHHWKIVLAIFWRTSITTIWQYKHSFKYEVVKVSAYWIY